MTGRLARLALLIALGLPALAAAAPPGEADPLGVLRKPIPDKLIVLTFDDGPASHATVVAPILKSLGFGGSFYVCDFDSFSTRKDWYLTWRQMRALAADGFEIGNHSKGHGSSLDAMLKMEEELAAHDVPKPTTVCWPLYQVAWNDCPALAAGGYTFGRGGHERPYRPTVDHPFDVPSFTIHDRVPVENFIKDARMASQGRIVVFTFHGVPDMEHPSVGLEPATFKRMMQYLKNNDYKVIALRDLADYIDPARAAKLPRTGDAPKESGLVTPATEDKPYRPAPAKDILEFAFPGLPGVDASKTHIVATLPYAADVTALAPTIKVSPGATIAPASGAARDFTRPQTYTVTGADGSGKVYTVTVRRTAASGSNEVLDFVAPGAYAASVSGSRIGVYVPTSTDVISLAPRVALPPFATAVPASGTARDFSWPQTYTVTAQDGSRRQFTVTVVKTDKPNAFTWNGGASGEWSDGAQWKGPAGAGSAWNAAGGADYILSFARPGDHEIRFGAGGPFQLNQLVFGVGQGHCLKLSGGKLAFVADPMTGVPPGVRVGAHFEHEQIANPIELGADLTVGLNTGSQMTLTGLISGPGGLVLRGVSPDRRADYNDRPCSLRIDNRKNTYRGGTVVEGGQLFLFVADGGLGTGPITVRNDGRLRLDNVKDIANPLHISGGLIEGGANWDAPITLEGNTCLGGHLSFNELGGGISGPGGITLLGCRGPWGWVNEGVVRLWGPNSFTGPIHVLRSTLELKKAAALYGGDPAQWTLRRITVAPAATLKVSAGGSGEFTGQEVGTLIHCLTAPVDNDGLAARAVFGIDTSKATAPVTVSADFGDSKGPGGGAVTLKKYGPGTLRLSGANSYSGQTVVAAGTLSVASLNRVADRQPSSNLGAPANPEAGTIEFADDGGLTYTGRGETTDRVIDLAGARPQTVTIDQSGGGILKFTSAFVYSGYGYNKTLVLSGSTAGQGELACNIANPHDRAGRATTAIEKTGTGRWTLSGRNAFTGPTTVREGTLALAGPHSLGGGGEVSIADGATLVLDFPGELKARRLILGGKLQPPGVYSGKTMPKFLHGPGVLRSDPAEAARR